DSVNEPFVRQASNEFSYELMAKSDLEYAIDVENKSLKKRGLSGNKVHVVKDAFPDIKANFDQDSLEANVLYYSAVISDDYGFSAMSLVIEEGGRKVSQKLDLKAG